MSLAVWCCDELGSQVDRYGAGRCRIVGGFEACRSAVVNDLKWQGTDAIHSLLLLYRQVVILEQ